MSICLGYAANPRLLFFFNDPATTGIYTLSLHDALPIFETPRANSCVTYSLNTVEYSAFARKLRRRKNAPPRRRIEDRKSTRLNSSHTVISYAVFCLKKKKPPIQ